MVIKTITAKMKVLCVSFLLVSLIQVGQCLIAWDSNCGVNLGCFPNCPGGCEYLVTWQAGGSGVTFSVSVEESETSVYAAIAFSNDIRMGEDSVVACLVPDSSVQSGYNEDTEYESLGTLGLSSTTVAQSGGVITCSFTRTFSESNSQYFDINNDYILMLVVGEVESEDGGYKLEEHHKIPWNSDKKVDFNSNEIVDVYNLNSPLIKLHGVMMVLAWLMMSVVGMITARYNKNMLPEKTLLGTKIWFQVHRGCMVLVVVFIVIGFIPVFVEVQGYSQIISSPLSAHPIIGIIVTALAFINPVMGLLRPGPTHDKRWLFNLAHLGVGYVAQLLAVVAVFLGYVLERSDLDISVIIVTAVHIAVIVLVVILFEVLKRKQNPQTDNSDQIKKSTDLNGTTTFEVTPKPEAKPSSLPMKILFVFSVVNLAFSLAALGLIAAAD